MNQRFKNSDQIIVFRIDTASLENWDFEIRIHSFVRSVSLVREYATPNLMPTSRPRLWCPHF